MRSLKTVQFICALFITCAVAIPAFAQTRKPLPCKAVNNKIAAQEKRLANTEKKLQRVQDILTAATTAVTECLAAHPDDAAKACKRVQSKVKLISERRLVQAQAQVDKVKVALAAAKALLTNCRPAKLLTQTPSATLPPVAD